MKPALSEKERAVLTLLGNKNPEQCDPFDSHIRGEIGRLSMAIDKGNTDLSKLKANAEEVEQDIVRNVGAFQATARTYLAYIESSMIRPVPAPTDPPNPSIPESQQEATGEPNPESDPPIPAEPETAKEDPKEEQDEAPEPKSEPAPEPEPETEPEKS